jgi:hypothetical protein
MRKITVAVGAAAFGLAVLIALADSSHAAPRVWLTDCIGKFNQCWWGCWRDAPLPPGPGHNYPPTKYCTNRCDANHSACVDLAMSPRTSAAGSSPAPATKLKKARR